MSEGGHALYDWKKMPVIHLKPQYKTNQKTLKPSLKKPIHNISENNHRGTPFKKPKN